MIRNVIDEAEELQEGHGGWNEDMTEVCLCDNGFENLKCKITVLFWCNRAVAFP